MASSIARSGMLANRRPCLPKSCKRTVRASARAALSQQRSIKPSNLTGFGAVFSVSLAALLAPAARAEGESVAVDGVDTAVSSVIGAVQATGQAVKNGFDILKAGFKVVQEGYEVAAPVLKQGIDTVAPVLEQAIKVTSDVAGPAFQAAAPAVESSLKEASKALESSGLPTKAITETTDIVAKTAVTTTNTAAPYVNKAIDFLSSKDPVTLAEYGLGLVALYYLAPPLLGLLGGSLRGFAGEVSAASALDSLNNEGGVVLIDIRTAKEKEASGIPDVPSSGKDKLLEVEFAYTEDKKLRGQLRDVNYIDVQITALQIAALKRVGKGSKILLLDRYGPVARSIAKELAAKGFGKVFVVAGGFDGRGGWVQSKLQIKPSAGLYTSPSGLAAATRIIRSDGAGRRALPAPKSA